jgi:hypothetical protein
MAVQPSASCFLALDEVREYLRIDSAQHDADDFLQRTANNVCDRIEKFTRSTVRVRTVTDILDGTGEETIILSSRPFVALATPGVSDLQYRSSVLTAWADLVTDVNQIIFDAKRPYMLRLYNAYFPLGIQNIKIVSKVGRVIVDGEIVDVALEAVADTYQKSRWGAFRVGMESRVQSFPQGGAATETFHDLSPRHKRRLTPYVYYMP